MTSQRTESAEEAQSAREFAFPKVEWFPDAMRAVCRPLNRAALCAFIVFFVYGCTSTAPRTRPDELLRGVASWYGEEFAGRTTANGEIFDPQRLTAAHRTLPFGTIVDVTNPKTQQSVRVRINDRGPYIGNRVIDLSWAAARDIGLVEAGVGEVDIRMVKIGDGEREPPAPFDVTIEPPKSIPAVAPPRTSVPVPAVPARSDEEDVVVDRVEVETERAGVATRRVVAQDGTTFETVPVDETSGAPAALPRVTPRGAADPRRPVPSARARPGFFVQVGAFAGETNARALQQRIAALGQRASIDRGDLYRVRIGPFSTRDEAVESRSRLEASGLSAIIVRE